MVVLSVEQYVMCGDILEEIVEGCPESDVETLYEIYLEQLSKNGIPYDETETNIYDMPEEFRAWVNEVRSSL